MEDNLEIIKTSKRLRELLGMQDKEKYPFDFDIYFNNESIIKITRRELDKLKRDIERYLGDDAYEEAGKALLDATLSKKIFPSETKGVDTGVDSDKPATTSVPKDLETSEKPEETSVSPEEVAEETRKSQDNDIDSIDLNGNLEIQRPLIETLKGGVFSLTHTLITLGAKLDDLSDPNKFKDFYESKKSEITDPSLVKVGDKIVEILALPDTNPIKQELIKDWKSLIGNTSQASNLADDFYQLIKKGGEKLDGNPIYEFSKENKFLAGALAIGGAFGVYKLVSWIMGLFKSKKDKDVEKTSEKKEGMGILSKMAITALGVFIFGKVVGNEQVVKFFKDKFNIDLKNMHSNRIVKAMRLFSEGEFKLAILVLTKGPEYLGRHSIEFYKNMADKINTTISGYVLDRKYLMLLGSQTKVGEYCTPTFSYIGSRFASIIDTQMSVGNFIPYFRDKIIFSKEGEHSEITKTQAINDLRKFFQGLDGVSKNEGGEYNLTVDDFLEQFARSTREWNRQNCIDHNFVDNVIDTSENVLGSVKSLFKDRRIDEGLSKILEKLNLKKNVEFIGRVTDKTDAYLKIGGHTILRIPAKSNISFTILSGDTTIASGNILDKIANFAPMAGPISSLASLNIKFGDNLFETREDHMFIPGSNEIRMFFEGDEIDANISRVRKIIEINQNAEGVNKIVALDYPGPLGKKGGLTSKYVYKLGSKKEVVRKDGNILEYFDESTRKWKVYNSKK